MAAARKADPAAVDRFLATHEFEGYQRVPLPHGRVIPGHDRSASADAAFARVKPGRSVLDVGTYYGYFALEAARRGARRVVAIEMREQRARIASEVARLYGDAFEVRRCSLEDLDPGDRFDVVLLLNVLHHAADPAAFLRTVRSLTTELAVVEFRDHLDAQFIGKGRRSSKVRREIDRAGVAARAKILDVASGDHAVIGIGDVPYGQVMYFSPAAFRNWFVTHLGLFSDVEIVDSPGSRGSRLAYCWV